MSAPPTQTPRTALTQCSRAQIITGAAIAAGIGAAAAMVITRFLRKRVHRRAAAEAAALAAPITRSELIFMGTGSSTGVPRAMCVANPESDCEVRTNRGDKAVREWAYVIAHRLSPCLCVAQTCRMSMIGPSELNRNWRGNPSLLIRFVAPGSASWDSSSSTDSSLPTVRNIQIDICKTFLSSALRLYPRYGVRSLDSVVITHDHADALLGMDDIRSMQSFDETTLKAATVPVHVTERTLASMRAKFHYLVPKQVGSSLATDSASRSAPHTPAAHSAHAGSVIVERKVAQLDFEVIRPFVPFRTCGLEILPLPVMHGEDYVSLGFLFGKAASGACLYVSDVTRIPEATWQFLCTGVLPTPPQQAEGADIDDARATQEWFERFNHASAHPLPKHQSKWSVLPDLPAAPSRSPASAASSGSSASSVAPRIALLVVDALFPAMDHNTHFSLPQALQFIERLQPDRALITGMSDLFEWHRDNAELVRKKAAGEITVDVQLAYDGLRIPNFDL